MSPRPLDIADYDPAWPLAFAELAEVYRTHLGDLLIRAEHVGSTSVPGLAAKPIIDIDLVIDARAHLSRVIEALAELGYEHLGERGIPGRHAFSRADDPEVPHTGDARQWPAHHLYVCDRDSDELARHVAFRDHLRAHPQLARRYGRLKRQLAEQHQQDRDAYCRAKTDFICGILQDIVPHLVGDARDNNSASSVEPSNQRSLS